MQNRRKKKRKDQKKKQKHEKHHRNNDQNSSSSAEDSEDIDSDHHIEESNAADSGSSKGVDHSKSTCSGEDIWKGPAKITVDKTREEEFEEYFQDMFL